MHGTKVLNFPAIKFPRRRVLLGYQKAGINLLGSLAGF